MTDPRPIAYDAHERWVQRNLVPGGALLLLLARLKGEAIGFTLLKMLSQNTMEIGVIFRDASRRPTLPAQAAAIMLHLAHDYFGSPWSVSYVRPEHTRAIDLNRGLGGIEVESDKSGMICFRLARAALNDNPRYRKLMLRVMPKLVIKTE